MNAEQLLNDISLSAFPSPLDSPATNNLYFTESSFYPPSSVLNRYNNNSLSNKYPGQSMWGDNSSLCSPLSFNTSNLSSGNGSSSSPFSISHHSSDNSEEKHSRQSKSAFGTLPLECEETSAFGNDLNWCLPTDTNLMNFTSAPPSQSHKRPIMGGNGNGGPSVWNPMWKSANSCTVHQTSPGIESNNVMPPIPGVTSFPRHNYNVANQPRLTHHAPSASLMLDTPPNDHGMATTLLNASQSFLPGYNNSAELVPLSNLEHVEDTLNFDHFKLNFASCFGDELLHLESALKVHPQQTTLFHNGGTASTPGLSLPHRANHNVCLNAHFGGTYGEEKYSKKVFVGGLPPDIDEEEITAAFRRFGQLTVDWPHKAESRSFFPPKGYCFLLFHEERSVQHLMDSCVVDDGKCYWCVSSPTVTDKMVQIRPWRLSDSDYVMNDQELLDPRRTIFVGGIPRPLKAFELANIMNRLYGNVCYAGIDTDPELKYPKGAGRVAFSTQQSYIAAIGTRFVQISHQDIEKRVEVKPYVLDDQLCDECCGARCGGKFAPFFCANVACLQYYCEHCWARIHARPGRDFHKPLMKEGTCRPRAVPYRW